MSIDPLNDAGRLAALAAYDILDTPPEPGFDDVVLVASQLCETPVALVSLVERERQWFKARIGFEGCETPIGQSVCAHALGQADLLIIPDLLADPRTRNNTLVTASPFIRFYAGAPLVNPDGAVLGTLCVIDVTPRPEGLTAAQASALQALARQVITLLELRRAVAERDAARERHIRREQRLALLAQCSAALLDANDPAAVLRPILEKGVETLGFDQSHTYDVLPDGCHLALTHSVGTDPDLQALLARVPAAIPLCGLVAESGERLVLSDLGASQEPRYAFAREIGLTAYAGFPITTGGAVAGVISFGSLHEARFDDETLAFFETIARFLSIARERATAVDRLVESDRRSRRAQEAGRIGTFEIDVDSSIATVSPEFCRLFGLPVTASMLADALEAVVVPEDRDLRSDPQSRRDGSAERDVEYRVRRADDGRIRWISRRAQFIRDESGAVVRMVGTVHDVTERKTLQVHQAALLDLGDRLREATSADDVVRAAADVLGRTLAASRAGYARVDLRGDVLEVQRGWTAPGEVSLEGRYGLSRFRATVDRLGRGETIAVANIKGAPWLKADLESYDTIGTRAQIMVPMIEKGDLVGLIYAQQAEPRTWTKDDVDFAHGVTDRTYAEIRKVQAEADQRILNQELSHRLKNTLAMVQAIASQTLRRVTEQDAVAAFTKRVHAISAAHDVLLQQSWSSARITDVVTGVLGTFGVPDRMDISGPDINLGPRATLSLSMILHELATNAIKYGALSNETGRIAVTWRLTGPDLDATIALGWTEAGGPPLREPDRKGFGSRLIGMGLVGTGGAQLRYRPDGLQAEFVAPLAQVQQP